MSSEQERIEERLAANGGSGGEASFKRIVDAGSLWTLPLAGGIAAWLILRGLRALRRD